MKNVMKNVIRDRNSHEKSRWNESFQTIWFIANVQLGEGSLQSAFVREQNRNKIEWNGKEEEKKKLRKIEKKKRRKRKTTEKKN